MSNLTIVIPLHKLDEEYKVMLTNCLNSIDTTDLDADIAIIGPKDVLAEAKTVVKTQVSYINNEKSDFCTQVNVAAKKINTPYFSILEVDDTLTRIWLGSVADYMSSNPAMAYLPLTQMIDYANGKFIGFINEIGWARGFYDKRGYLSIDSIEGYCDFNMSGAIINRDSFIAIGGLKTSIKVFHWYEFILRALHHGKDIFVVPKIGCKHYVNRPDSMMLDYYKSATKEETTFWYNTAREEYLHEKDKEITYKTEE